MNGLWQPEYDPADPDTFFLPEYWRYERARRLGMPAEQLLSPEYAKRVTGVGDGEEASDLAHRLGGRAVRPQGEVILRGADGRTPVIIPALGACEAAELEEIAIGVYEEQEKRLREGRPLVDFDELRARDGLPPREEFDPLFRQALRERIARHRANPVTDPGRNPHKPRGYVTVAKVEGANG